MRRILTIILGMLVLFATSSVAGSLSIRLIEASNRPPDNPAGIEDVHSILKNSTAYENFVLVAQQSQKLPVKDKTSSLGSYRVRCRGRRKSLSITVTRGKADVFDASVSLKKGKPLIIGGLPSTRGKMILVFVAK